MKCCTFLPLGKCNKIYDKKDSIAASLFSDQTKIESASILYVKFGAIPSQTKRDIAISQTVEHGALLGHSLCNIYQNLISTNLCQDLTNSIFHGIPCTG